MRQARSGTVDVVGTEDYFSNKVYTVHIVLERINCILGVCYFN